ncbi:MAG: HlyD family type I secretion periplasmic adaptor subunit [Asticcacaulis sp.]
MTFQDDNASEKLGRADLEKWIGLGVVTLFFIIFLGWAMFAKLDSAATASGFVVVSGDRKSVQHEALGVVHKLYISDGDHVVAGQLLLDIDDESDAESKSTLSTLISLRADINRAEALRDGRTSMTLLRPGDYPVWAANEVEEANRTAQSLLHESLQNLHARQFALEERALGARAQASANRSQAQAAASQSRVVSGRYRDLKDLYDRGLVPAPQMLELEQRRIALDGELASRNMLAQANESDAIQAGREARSYQASIQADAAQQLSDARSRLNALEPKWREAQDRFARSQVRSPVSGRIVNLAIHTEGGVVSAGQVLMEVVPDEQPLQIEAHLSPTAADQIKPGMDAQVRFSGFKDRSTPIFEGKVRSVSADRLEDKRNGQPYFLLTVDLPPETLKKISEFSAKGFKVMPGLQADIVVPVESRTALDYIVGPLRNAIWKSFREH